MGQCTSGLFSTNGEPGSSDEAKTASNAATGWVSLPPELQAAVVSQLPFLERARLRRVSQAWKTCLDGNRGVWADVRRLALALNPDNIGMDRVNPVVLKGPDVLNFHYTISKEGQRRRCDKFLIRLRSALAYLAPRCPLATLELYSVFPSQHTEMSLAIAAEAPMKLKSLVVLQSDFRMPFTGDRLATLIRSQPLLQTLVLQNLRTTEDRWTSAELLASAEELVDLRVLVLHVTSLISISAMSASLLSRLDCLSVCYEWLLWREDEAVMRAAAAGACQHVRDSAPELLLQGHELRGERWSRILWAREGFQWETAMADKTSYSRNFLRDWDTLF